MPGCPLAWDTTKRNCLGSIAGWEKAGSGQPNGMLPSKRGGADDRAGSGAEQAGGGLAAADRGARPPHALVTSLLL